MREVIDVRLTSAIRMLNELSLGINVSSSSKLNLVLISGELPEKKVKR